MPHPVNVFISSVIRGLEAEREAAARAAIALDHAVFRSEDFGALATSPQRACRAAVRAADVVLLVLSAAYGTKDPTSGLSPTHEEFREAQESGRDVLVFVHEGVLRDADQEALVREVRAWAGGSFTGSFADADELRDEVTRALKRFELSRVSGAADPAEISARLDEAAAPTRSHTGTPTLQVVVVAGPRQTVLAPARMDEAELQRDLERDALYGTTPVLERGAKTESRVDGNSLVIEQEHARVSIDSLGTISVTRPARSPRGERDWMNGLIDEDVRDAIAIALRYAMATLDKLDPYERLTDVGIAAAMHDLGYLGWRTRAEHERKPNSSSMNMHGATHLSATVQPPTRKRAAARQQVDANARDLTALLRRQIVR